MADKPTSGPDGDAATPSSGQPAKRTVQSRRVTAKGGTPTAAPKRKSTSAHREPEASSRYTPPSHSVKPPSRMWVPILMFGLMIAGALVIILNYVGLLGDVSNVKLVIGLALILGGIITATQYR